MTASVRPDGNGAIPMLRGAILKNGGQSIAPAPGADVWICRFLDNRKCESAGATLPFFGLKARPSQYDIYDGEQPAEEEEGAVGARSLNLRRDRSTSSSEASSVVSPRPMRQSAQVSLLNMYGLVGTDQPEHHAGAGVPAPGPARGAGHMHACMRGGGRGWAGVGAGWARGHGARFTVR